MFRGRRKICIATACILNSSYIMELCRSSTSTAVLKTLAKLLLTERVTNKILIIITRTSELGQAAPKSTQKSIDDERTNLQKEEWEILDKIQINGEKAAKAMEKLLQKLPSELTAGMTEKALH